MESVSQSILKLLIFLDTVQWLSKAQAGDPVKTLRKVGLKTSTPDLGSDTVLESGNGKGYLIHRAQKWGPLVLGPSESVELVIYMVRGLLSRDPVFWNLVVYVVVKGLVVQPSTSLCPISLVGQQTRSSRQKILWAKMLSQEGGSLDFYIFTLWKHWISSIV